MPPIIDARAGPVTDVAAESPTPADDAADPGPDTDAAMAAAASTVATTPVVTTTVVVPMLIAFV